MVKVIIRARRLAGRAAEGSGKTKATFGGRRGSRARLGWRALDSERPVSHTYLRHGLLMLGGVAAGLLLGRRSKRGEGSTSPSSHTEGTGDDATGRITPYPAGPPQEPADVRAGGTDRPRPAPQDAVPPAPPSFAEPPRPEDPTGRSDEDLDRALNEGVPSRLSSSTSSGKKAFTTEEPPAAQEAEPPTDEVPGIVEKLPPPHGEPNVSEEPLPSPAPPPSQNVVDELPPPPQVSDVALPPPPSAPDVAEELPPTEEAPSIVEGLPPPPEVTEAELPPPPVPENAVDELPPPPVPEEQNVGDAPPPSTPEPPTGTGGEATRTEGPRAKHVTATAEARRRAEELGVDLLEVEGTGPNGRITVDDVRRRDEQTRS